jgi:tetratricopeptide (TPR) repeat protein
MQNSELIERTWELYSQQKFQEIVSVADGHSDSSLTEIRHLALMELGQHRNFTPKGDGMFGELYRAMQSYHKRNFETASKGLAAWILKRGYYGPWVIDRFVESCRRSLQFDLLFRVSSHLIQRNQSPQLAEAVFLALYHLGKYEDALKIFDTYREHFSDGTLMQYAGECLMKLQRYDEAERFFLALFKQMSGKDYHNNYEEVRDRYVKAMPELKALEKKQGLTEGEWMEIGMGYLFTGEYRKALEIFQKIKKMRQMAA